MARQRNPQGSIRSYRLKDGAIRWQFVIDLGEVRVGARLQRQQLKRSGFARKIDAQAALEKELPAIRAETAPTLADRATTLSQYLDHWLAIGRKANGDPWRPSTAATYRSSADCYLRPGLGHYRVAELRRSHVEALANKMRDGIIRPGRHTAPLSQRTIHQARATLRAALTQAVADGLIATNPAGKGARVPGPGRAEVQVWTPEQLTAFLGHAREREPRLVTAYQLCAWRGLRR